MTSISVQTSFGPIGVSAGFAGSGPVALKAVTSPLVVVSSTPGQQGLTGPPGAGYGFATYTDTGPVLALAANTRTLVSRPVPTASANLKPPFALLTLWNGVKITPRAALDVMETRFDITLTPLAVGGTLKIEIDIGGSVGVINTEVASLPGSAGVSQLVSVSLVMWAKSTFIANGGSVYLTSSVTANISAVNLSFVPLSIA